VFSATANFHVGGLRNTLIAGFDAGYQNADRTIYAYTLPTRAQYTYQLGDHSPTRANIGMPLFNPTNLPPPGYTVVRTATILANFPPARVWVYRKI